MPTPTRFQPLRIGAGGWITGIDQANDGTKVIRTDTFGAYIWNDSRSQWDQLVAKGRMPANYYGVDSADGCFEIAIAPSDSNYIYMAYLGRILRSADKGLTFDLCTNFAEVTMSANSQSKPNGIYHRAMGRKMVVDPINPKVVFFGSEANGLYRSVDGGDTWTSIASVLTSTNGAGIILAFDPSSATTNGRTQGIYASSEGRGVYYSSDGGATFSLTSATNRPTSHSHMVCAPNGTLFLLDSAAFVAGTNNLKKYSGGSWTIDTNAGTRGHSVCINPNDANHIILGADNGSINVSKDGGSTWSGYDLSPGHDIAASDIPWLAWTNESYMSNGDMVFDRVVSGRLYFAMGIGVMYVTPPDSATGYTWNSQSTGIEQLICNNIICPPGKRPIMSSWDRPLFRCADPDTFPSTHGPTEFFSHAWAVDYASSDPNYIAAIVKQATNTSCYSTDAGATWTLFPSNPSFLNGSGDLNNGGCIAVSTPSNIVQFGSNNGDGFYTTDGGTSWNRITFPSPVPAADPPGGGDGGADVATGWGFAYYTKRHIVCADRVTTGTFRAFNYLYGTFESTDSGATWTRVSTATLGGESSAAVNSRLKSVPGNADHMFFTGGPQGNRGSESPADTNLYRTSDGGRNWTTVSNVKEVYDFGFGAAAPGQSYPAVFIVGWVSGVYGVWRSDDNCSTWEFLTDYPMGWGDGVASVTGDMSQYGTVYIGFGGSGACYGKLETRLAGLRLRLK